MASHPDEAVNWEKDYDIAQICLNGHVITSCYRDSSSGRKAFCDKCGQPTITECPSCARPIRGAYRGGWAVNSHLPPASFCEGCGKPFPWTIARIRAVEELVSLADVSAEERERLTEDLPDLMSETPRTVVATRRWQVFLEKVGKPMADGFKDILVQVVVEGAKRQLFQ